MDDVTTDPLYPLRRAWVTREIATIDILRELPSALAHSNEADISYALTAPIQNIRGALAESSTIEPVVEGFSGADPEEIIKRHFIGQISTEQLIDELTRWDYPVEQLSTMDTDDTYESLPGSFDQVSDARGHRLLDGPLYTAIVDRLHRR